MFCKKVPLNRGKHTNARTPMRAMHGRTHTHTHTCVNSWLHLQPGQSLCFDNNDTVFIMTFPSDWSQGRGVHSLGLSAQGWKTG